MLPFCSFDVSIHQGFASKSEIASWIGSVPQRGSVGSNVVVQIP